MSNRKHSEAYKAFLYDMHMAAASTTGLYPRAHTTIHADGTSTTVERTPEQEGWNRRARHELAIRSLIDTFAESLTATQREMLSKLVESDDVFIFFEMRGEEPSVKLTINCNDVFAWACADTEEITLDEIPKLYAYVFDDEGNRLPYGSIAYACIVRNEQPQPPLKEDMIRAGAWTEQLESLPRNYAEEMETEDM